MKQFFYHSSRFLSGLEKLGFESTARFFVEEKTQKLEKKAN